MAAGRPSSNFAELCITVGRGEDETGVVISQLDHFHKLRFEHDQRQTTINSITVQMQKQNSVGFLGQNGLLGPPPYFFLFHCSSSFVRSSLFGDCKFKLTQLLFLFKPFYCCSWFFFPCGVTFDGPFMARWPDRVWQLWLCVLECVRSNQQHIWILD